MACCGLDFDLLHSNVDHLVETMEDMPVYWIQTGPKPNGEECLKAEGGSGLLVPFLVQDDVKSIEESSKHWLKNLDRLRRKFNPRDRDVSLSDMEKLKRGFMKEMPEYYVQIFKRIDGYNSDVGITADKKALVHKCAQDSILDKAYSFKPYKNKSRLVSYLKKFSKSDEEESSWILNRHTLNYRYTDDYSTANAEIQSTAKTIEEIHRHRMSDATAIRFYVLKEQTKKLKSKSHWVFLISALITICTTFLLSFFMLTGSSLLVLFSYVVAVFLGLAILRVHIKKDTFNRFVENRCLAKYLRVRYNLSLLGIEEDLPMTFYDHKRNDTFWVRAAMMAWNSHFMNDKCNEDSIINPEAMLVFVKHSWPLAERRRNAVLLNKCERVRAVGSIMNKVFYALIAMVSVTVILGSTGILGEKVVFNLEGMDAFGMELVSDITFDPLNFTKLLLMMIVALFAGLSILRDHYISSTPEQMMAEERMYDISLGRIDAITSGSSAGSSTGASGQTMNYSGEEIKNLKKLYAELGNQCVRENCEWVLKVKGLNVTSIGFGNVRSFYKYPRLKG